VPRVEVELKKVEEEGKNKNEKGWAAAEGQRGQEEWILTFQAVHFSLPTASGFPAFVIAVAIEFYFPNSPFALLSLSY
jgi:hypothetical protein